MDQDMTSSTPENPKVTVLMPVFNGERYLRSAIDSILNQTFRDFEFLIIDDGSTDSSDHIITSCGDPRIRLVRNETNLGLIATLNKGLRLALGEYIVRMDCDDISLPSRLAVQVSAMDRNQEWGVCGSWIKILKNADAAGVQTYPPDHDTIKCELLFDTPLAHPSVIYRRSVLEKHHIYYDERYKHAEDYEMWCRLIRLTLLANIPQILMLYRIHGSQMGRRYLHDQRDTASQIRIKQIESLGITPTEKEVEIHQKICTLHKEKTSRDFIDTAESWFLKLHQGNASLSFFPEPAFSRTIGFRWFIVCKSASEPLTWKINRFIKTPLRNIIRVDWKRLLDSFIANKIK